MVDLKALADEDITAQVELRPGDELRFTAGAQRFYMAWQRPVPLDWAWDAREELMVLLLERGVHTEPVGALAPEVDETGLGRTYRLELVRLRVIAAEGPVMAGTLPGAEPEILEAGAGYVVVLAASIVAVLVAGAMLWDRVALVTTPLAEAVPPQAFTRAAGAAQLVGLALAIAAGAWAVKEARQW